MMKQLMALLLLIVSWSALTAPPAILRFDAGASMAETYQAISSAPEEARLWVVFEADLGATMAGFAERWGEDLNRNALDGKRSIVVCNVWYANHVSHADPDSLALCPMRLKLVEKGGATRVLLARPTLIADGSPGNAMVQGIEDAISAGLFVGVAAEG